MINRTPTYCSRSMSKSNCRGESFKSFHSLSDRIHLRGGSVTVTGCLGSRGAWGSVAGAGDSGRASPGGDSTTGKGHDGAAATDS